MEGGKALGGGERARQTANAFGPSRSPTTKSKHDQEGRTKLHLAPRQCQGYLPAIAHSVPLRNLVTPKRQIAVRITDHRASAVRVGPADFPTALRADALAAALRCRVVVARHEATLSCNAIARRCATERVGVITGAASSAGQPTRALVPAARRIAGAGLRAAVDGAATFHASPSTTEGSRKAAGLPADAAFIGAARTLPMRADGLAGGS